MRTTPLETILPKRGLSIAGAAASGPRKTREETRLCCGVKEETIMLTAIAAPRFLKIVPSEC
jgi:hypothetical protein